ncbi:MAG: GAF domain-containing protein [Pseudomonadota bacterium]
MSSADARVAMLRSLAILDTPPEAAFDAITSACTRLFSVPVSCITLMDDTRFFFKSAQGMDTGSQPLSAGFCGSTVQDNRLRIVTDTHKDDLTRNHALVCAAPHLRFYAGAPLVVGNQPLGTLCLMDTQPREFSVAEGTLLTELAGLVEVELEQRRQPPAARTPGLAVHVAQQLGNHLTAIQGHCSLLASEASSGTEQIQNVFSAASLAAELTHQLVMLTGGSPPRLQPLDLSSLLEHVVGMLRPAVPAGTRLSLSLDDHSVWVCADAVQLRQALMFLIVSAAEFGDEGGSVLVQLRRSDDDVVRLSVRPTHANGDAGPPSTPWHCWPEAELARALAAEIAQAHGGRLEQSEDPEAGAVHIVLPWIESREAPEEHGAPAAVAGQHLLAADPSDPVRRLLQAAAQHLELSATVVAGLDDLREALRTREVPPDIILLDVTLAEGENTHFLRELTQAFPHVSLVVTSAFDQHPAFVELSQLGIRVLRKPFDLAQLHRALTQRPRSLSSAD